MGLAKMIAMEEMEDDIEDIGGGEIQRIYLELYHSHLPRLAEHEAVDFDERRMRVRLAERATPLTAVLSFVDDTRT